MENKILVNPVCKDLRKWAKEHPKFMTPNILKLRKSGFTFVELSSGTDFNHNSIYGVSIIEFKNNEFKTGSDKSKMFYSREEAEIYFKKVI